MDPISQPQAPAPPPVTGPSPVLPNYPTPSKRPSSGLVIVLVVLGVLVLILSIVAIIGWSRASSANSDQSVAKQQAYQQGKSDQAKVQSDKASQALNEPYKTYTAPVVYGSFVVSYPKTWNASAAEDTSGNQLNLILNPDIIKTIGDNNYATRILLETKLYSSQVTTYASQVKAGDLKASSATVSGIAGQRYTGKFDSKHKNATLILLPVRDKTMSIWNDDAAYIGQYNDIVSRLKITP